MNNPLNVESKQDWPSPAIAWLWCLALFLAYICSFIDRQILSLMVDSIRADLDITDSQFGLLHGLSFALLYITLGLPVGSLVDRYQRRRIVIFGIVLWSSMTALCGIAQNFGQLVFARLGVGAGEATLSPAAYSLMSDLFPPSRLGRAMALFISGAGIGSGIALIVGGVFIEYIKGFGTLSLPLVGTLKSWQVVFIVVALPGVVVSMLIALFREPDRHGRKQTVSPPWSSIFQFIKKRWAFFIPFLLGIACATMVSIATLSWAPALMMRVYGLSTVDVGIDLGLITMLAITAGLFGGAWLTEIVEVERKFFRLSVSIFGFLLTVPASWYLMSSADSGDAYAALFLLMFFTNIPMGVAAAKVQSITPNEMRGRISAIYLLVVSGLGMVLGPLVPGLMTDYLFQGDKLMTGVSLSYSLLLWGILGSLLLFTASRNIPESN